MNNCNNMERKRLKNPFVIIGNIPQEYFCDRRLESAQVVRTLTNESNLLLMSARRLGKSGLIKYCFEQPEIKSSYYTFYIDILHTSGIREFVCTFGAQVFEQLKGRGEKTLRSLTLALRSIAGSFGYDPLTGTPTFQLELGKVQQPEYTLKEIFDWLEQADKPCIVAFDEFQQIANYPEKNIEALLRGYIQHLKNVHFVYAGSERHLLTEMFLSSARPFYNSTSQLQLDPIVIGEYVPFVSHWFKENVVTHSRTPERTAICNSKRRKGSTYYEWCFYPATCISIGKCCSGSYEKTTGSRSYFSRK